MVPKPQYFIVRRGSTQDLPLNGHAVPESSIVPLIPVDLLPEWVDIQGIPRRLSLGETVGMTNLGSFAAPNEVLKLRFLSLCQGDNTHGKSLSGDSEGRGSGSIILGAGEHMQQHDSQSSSGATSHTLHEANSNSFSRRSTGPPAIPRNSEVGINISAPRGPRTYDPRYNRKACQAWCHHGRCPKGAFCRSRHEMPQTLKGLIEVGLDDFPVWYKTVHNMRIDKVSGGSKGLPPVKKKRTAIMSFEKAQHSDIEVGNGAMGAAGDVKPNINGGEMPMPNGVQEGESDDDQLLIDMWT